MTAQIVVDNGVVPGSTWHRAFHRATVRAVERDLHRLYRILPVRMAQDRRNALVEHVDFLAERTAEAHAAIDGTIWPRVRRRRPDLQEMADEAAASHRGLAIAFHTAVRSAHWWGGDPGRAQAFIADLHRVGTYLEPGAGIDDGFLAETSSVATAGEWSQMRRTGYDAVSPARRVYRICWQLDELDPALAEPLTDGMSRPATWLLYTGFTGGYHGRAQLMWQG